MHYGHGVHTQITGVQYNGARLWNIMSGTHCYYSSVTIYGQDFYVRSASKRTKRAWWIACWTCTKLSERCLNLVMVTLMAGQVTRGDFGRFGGRSYVFVVHFFFGSCVDDLFVKRSPLGSDLCERLTASLGWTWEASSGAVSLYGVYLVDMGYANLHSDNIMFKLHWLLTTWDSKGVERFGDRTISLLQPTKNGY